MPEPEWYYATEEGTRGPVPAGELVALLRARALPPDVQVWSPGLPGWRSAREVPELEPTLQRPPRPPAAGAARQATPAAFLLVHAWAVANGLLLVVVVLTALGWLR